MQKLVLSWLLGGVLCCVLLVDLLLLNYNQQQCSLCVQLDTASLSSLDHNTPEIAGGFRLVQAHSSNKKGIVIIATLLFVVS